MSEKRLTFAWMDGLFNECALTAQFVENEVSPVLANGGLSPLQHLGWQRSIAWQGTLTRLTSPADFQAVFAAARSLLEIVVDAVLLKHIHNASELARDWEISAKLKSAEGIARYYAKGSIPTSAQHAVDFAKREASQINARRLRHGWKDPKGKPRHAGRWTDKELGADAKRADKFESDLGLEKIYETQYREMCWYVHGSGAVGLEDIPAEDFPALGGLVFRTCTDLIVAHAKLLLRYVNQWDVAHDEMSWADRFILLRRRQVLTVKAISSSAADDDSATASPT